jgi:uncharacterized protein with ParB-like and HNH nuclease domain
MVDATYNNDRENIIDDTWEDTILFQYSITSYGADYPVDMLVKRLQDGTIFTPPFQRGYIWPITEASRFIESLLLGLPVPGIFLSKEQDTEKMLIIDGQQRLKTLQYFYEGIIRGKEFKLNGVQNNYEGKTIKTLNVEDVRRLSDSIIHATIIKQDKPSEDNSSIFYIFERLNSSGIQLQPQEIRACIFHGPFRNLLVQLKDNADWKNLYGPTSARLKDEELILRFFAFYFEGNNYKRPIKEFLNSYMGENRLLKKQNKNLLKGIFISTTRIINQNIGKDAFRPERSLNAAVCEAMMVGVAKRLERGGIKDTETFKERYFNVIKDIDFLTACKTGTSDETKIALRLTKATNAFRDVQ